LLRIGSKQRNFPGKIRLDGTRGTVELQLRLAVLDHLDAQGSVIGARVRLWFPAGLEDDAAETSEDAAQARPIPKASTLETESVENVPEGLP